MTAVRCIRPHEVHEFWPLMKPLVERALARQKSFDRTSVHCRLEDGRLLAFMTWPQADCIVLVEITILPKERVMHVFAVAGRLPDDWDQILADLENWGRNEGCSAVEFRGRWGWTRRLKGYATPRVIYRKELAHA